MSLFWIIQVGSKYNYLHTGKIDTEKNRAPGGVGDVRAQEGGSKD